MKLVFFGKEKIIQKVSIVLLLCRYFKGDRAKYNCLHQMWRCSVLTTFSLSTFFLAGNSKTVNCCCAVINFSQIQMSSSDVTVHSVLTRFSQSTFFGGKFKFLTLNSKSVNCIEVVVPLLHRAKYKCLHQMWQCTVFWRGFHYQLFVCRSSWMPYF